MGLAEYQMNQHPMNSADQPSKGKQIITATQQEKHRRRGFSLWAGRGPAVHWRRAVSSRFKGAHREQRESAHNRVSTEH